MELFLRTKTGDGIERLLKNIQVGRYLKVRAKLAEKGAVVVNDEMLKFHNLDKRSQYRDLFEENLKNITI